MPVDKLTIEQFAQKVKAKYPQYMDVNDSVLVEKMVAKYPEYKSKISYDASNQQQSTSSFKSATDWLSIQQGYQPIVPGNEVAVVDSHEDKVAKSKQRVSEHLSNIDNSVHNLIYEKKKDLKGRIVSEQLGLNPKEIGPTNPQAQQLEAQLDPGTLVTPEEIEGFKSDMSANQVMTRQALNQKAKDLTKTDPAAAKKLKADVYRLDRQNDPGKDDKISKNIEKIDEGEYDYDVVNGRLVKPEGFWSSLVTGYKEKVNAFDDYDVYKSGDEKAIMNRINERLKDDPDKAIPVPEAGWFAHPAAELARMAGGQPLKPLIGGGGAGLLLGPEAGAAAAAAISAPEMYKLAFGSLLPHNYGALKKQNPNLSDSEILQKAIDLTNSQANTDAFVGAAMGGLAAKIGFAPTGLNNGLLQKSLGNALKQIGQGAVKKTIEGLGVGTVGAAGQYVKNILAQKAGIPTDTSEGLAQQLWGGVGMTMAMTMIAKVPKLLNPKTYNQMLQSLRNVPTDELMEHVQRLEKEGVITHEEGQSAQQAIEEHQALDNSIKPNVPESDRVQVQELIKKRNELEASLETEDKAYHAETKEKIKELNERINNVSKGVERGELQKLVDQEHKAGNLEGFATDVLRNASENDLKKYLKEISEQVYSGNEEAAVQAFGENIVNKAKELYPKEPAKESSVSVIRPGEINQHETITISPREVPKDISSTERVSVTMPRGLESEAPILPEPNTTENAVPVRGPEEIPLDETSGSSQPVGEGISESGEAANAQEIGIPAEENAATGKEGLGGGRDIGITHRQMDAMAEEFGLPTYQDSPERVAEWDQQAAKKIQEPGALDNLFTKLRNGEVPDHVETRMMLQYMSDILAKIDKDPYNRELQDQLIRTKDLFNVAGRLQGKGLAARKGSAPVEETLGDFLIRDRESNKAPLTDEQITTSKKEYDEIKAAKDALDDRVAKLEADNARLKAEKAIEKIKKSEKKSGTRDFKAEREQILKDMKNKWDSSKGKMSATFIPYADRLVEIAPDVAKLIKVLVEEGVDNLPDLVSAAHAHLSNFVHGITEKDVHDLIAGEYNKPKQTKNQISEKIFDLRTEAKLINRLEALENGDEPKNEKGRIKRNREIEALRQQIKEHDLTKLAARKSRLKGEIEKLQEQFRTGQFSEPKKSEIKLDQEGNALNDELIRLKQEREKRLAKLEFENRTSAQKALDAAANVLNVPRTLMASVDLSAPLRQGVIATVAHPGIAAKAFPEMIRQAFSQKQFNRWLTDLKSSPEFKVMEDSGLYVADPNSLHLSQHEEAFMSNLAEKIPVVGRLVKGSERGYVGYLNKMRVDLFKQGTEIFADQGRTFENSPELYKGLATFVNNATGRGGLGPLNKSAPILNTAFFSPRLIASRLNMINPVFYTKLPKEVRIMALKDMAKVIGFGMSILGLAAAAGAQVEKDPRSSDFGKIRVDNTRWDIWGGFQQYARLFAQLMSGQTKSSNTGEIYELKGDKFPYKTRLDQLGSFFRGKLAPVPGLAVDLIAGKTVVGEEIAPAKKAYELFVPMIAQDIADAWKEQGPKAILTTGVPSAFGVGVTTYQPKESGGGSSKKSTHSKKHISHKRN